MKIVVTFVWMNTEHVVLKDIMTIRTVHGESKSSSEYTLRKRFRLMHGSIVTVMTLVIVGEKLITTIMKDNLSPGVMIPL